MHCTPLPMQEDCTGSTGNNYLNIVSLDLKFVSTAMYILAYLHDVTVIEYEEYLTLSYWLQALDILHNGKS